MNENRKNMENRSTKKMPPGQSEEEVAQWLLTHDTTDYVDVSKMEMPNLHRAGHVIPVTVRDDEFSQLSELAAKRKKSLAETIGILLHHSLSELRANPSARL
jgi:hypothetical protein